MDLKNTKKEDLIPFDIYNQVVEDSDGKQDEETLRKSYSEFLNSDPEVFYMIADTLRKYLYGTSIYDSDDTKRL